MSARLHQLRAPALESWIAEVLSDSAVEQQSAVSLIPAAGDDDGSEPILSSCLRPKRHIARPSDVSELSMTLEGDELEDLLRFDDRA